MDEATRKALKSVLKIVNERVEKNNKNEKDPIAFLASERPDLLEIQHVPTNVPPINEAMRGGLATQCIHVFYGSEGVGKTAIAATAMANHQNRGGVSVYVCSETPIPVKTLIECGVNMEELVIMRPLDYGEQLIDAIKDLLWDKSKNTVTPISFCITFDSINAIVAKSKILAQQEEGSEKATMTTRARLLTDFLEEVPSRNMLRNDSLLIIISQLRTRLAGPYAILDMSGIQAVRFMPKTVTYLKKGKDLLEKIAGQDQPIGHIVDFQIKKNNIDGRPTRGTYSVLYEVPELNQKAGVDDATAIAEAAMEYGFVVKDGRKAFIVTTPEMSEPLRVPFSKKNEFLDWLREHTDVKESLRRALQGKDSPQTAEPLDEEDSE
jgi:RecA/RadA recombinase